MKMENSDDLAIETLLAVSAELVPDLEIDLLKRCISSRWTDLNQQTLWID